MTPKFVHLRTHTLYSLGKSSLTMNTLMSLAKKYNMTALAITDSNNMFGVCEFSTIMAENGIKPIIGIELTIRYNLEEFFKSNNVFNSTILENIGNRIHHNFNKYNSKSEVLASVVLLAKNKQGYLNLLKIHKELYIDRDKNIPLSISLNILSKYSQNLILLSGGNEGFLGNILLYKNSQLNDLVITQLKEYFKDNFYIEIERYSNAKGINLQNEFLNLALKYNLPIVATANPCFTQKEDYEANDILMCIGQGTTINNYEREFLSKEQYFKSQDEMVSLFKDLPEALENTIKIAQKCNFLVKKVPPTLPLYEKGIDEVALLTNNAKEGLNKKLKHYLQVLQKEKNLTVEEINNIETDYFKRLNYEIEIISKMNFAGYFLIVADFINWAKKNDIPVGPGRGSGAGSLVAWSLDITTINPIQFGLFFERFLNPERVSMPDFDIDFCQQRRDEVINYVASKYGQDRVGQIITFGSLQTRAALRDVGRVLGLPYASVDKICKRIPYSTPSNPINITKVLQEEEELKKDIEKYYMLNNLFSIALKLENLYKNTSTHAAGIVISSRPLVETVPLYRDDSKDDILSIVGFSMKYVEEVGLVKFDFLGLKTLTVINSTVKSIKKIKNIDLDINNIPLRDDIKIHELLSSGKTLGIFQLESLGMRDVLVKLKPDKIEDIIAVISLYRPGPMENIPVYINRKHGKEKVEYLHPLLQQILEETFGIMVYQEQVMQIAQKLAGYSLGKADLLRRAMGKKKPKEMAEQKDEFLKGAKLNNVDCRIADIIFEQMAKFAGYGFNKSHAAAYALISWQTAYLKAYYPAEFIAESMTYDMHDVDKLAILVEEAKDLHIKILPPDINYTYPSFIATQDKDNNSVIRYSILAGKGVSKTLVEAINQELVNKGKFTSIEDFLYRIPPNFLNKKQLEALIKSGSFDSLEKNRGKLLKNIDKLLSFNTEVHKEQNSTQAFLFDMTNLANNKNLILEDSNDMPFMEKLVEEASIIGFFISDHPLNMVAKDFEQLNIIKYKTLIDKKIPSARLAIIVLKIKISKTRSNDKYITLSCSDISSTFNIVLFAKSFEKFANKVQEGGVYLIDITAKFSESETKIFVDDLHSFDCNNYNIKQYKNIKYIDNANKEESVIKSSKALNITINDNKELFDGLKEILLNNKREGNTPIILTIKLTNGKQYDFDLGIKVLCDEDFLSLIQEFATVSFVNL